MEKDKTYRQVPPLTTWQFFHASRMVLGDSFLQKIWKKSLRQIYRWSANPDFVVTSERNPLDCLCAMIRKLKEIGRDDIAYSGIRILAELIDCELVPQKHPEPDKEFLQDECLDDYPALVGFHRAIQEADPPELVKLNMERAIQEIRETYEKYRQTLGGREDGSN